METKSIQQISDIIADCPNCSLAKTRINAVPGQGNPQAKIMFVGEAPGKNEDLKGIPFVGAAGKYLDKLLALANLSRDTIFITNIVKCRPPENRDPLPTEIDEFEMSSSNRKILFITPEQLKSNCLADQKRFDLFVNHESFSEMDIDVVNSYLGYLPKLMKKDSFVFLVNRHSRPQARSYDHFKEMELSGITCFSDYKLEFCSEVIKRKDLFRAVIPGQRETPNVFYIGKVLD